MKNIVIVYSIVGLLLCSCSVAATKKVLIVGAGINGASAAYFLRQEEPDENKLEIHVAEAEPKVGGRVLDTEIVRATGAKKLVEVGASVYHSVNKYMVHFAKLANATPTRPYINSKLGVWDGPPPLPGSGHHYHSTFPFKESELMSPLDKAVTSIQALWRYNSAVMKLGGCVENLVEKLLRWYEMQEQGHVFDTVEDMLEAVDLRRFATEETLVEYLTSAECGMDANSPLLSEVVHGMVRLNYGQHYQTINALAGCVALKGRGDEVFGVEGGNKRIITALMEKADVEQVHLGCPVTIKNGGVSSTCSLLEDMKWDALILAHPRWEEDAKTKKQDTPSQDKDQTAMFITVVSFVEGFLNETVFDDSLPPTVTVTSLKAREGRLRNIRHVGRVSSPTMSGDQSEVFPGIYKMFSDTPLSKDDLAQVFHTDAVSGFVAKVLYSHEWRGAYPDLSQKQTSSKLASHKPANKQSKRFVLSAASNDGPVIIDANALEVAVSTMETQSIAAKNAALLAKRELGLGQVHHGREKAAVEDKNEL